MASNHWQDFQGSSVVTNLPSNAGDMGSIAASERSPEEGNGNPLQFSCMGNPMNRGDWWSIAHGVAKERDMTQQLNNNKNHWQDFFSFIWQHKIPGFAA